VVEGAIRKWVLPELSGPLLLVRDPVAIFIYWQVFRAGRIKPGVLLLFVAVAVPICLFAFLQILAGINTLPIAAYGLRSYLLHLPMLWAIGYVFRWNDVVAMGKTILVLCVPVTIIMVLQFQSPAGSWLNEGVGGNEGYVQLGSAAGHVRASGPFSYVMGAVSFTSLVVAFVIFGLGSPRVGYSATLLYVSGIAALIAVPVSGSRTMVFLIAAILMFATLSGAAMLRRVLKIAYLVVTVGVPSAVMLWQVPAFQDLVTVVQDATDVLGQRWGEAANVEGNTAEVLNLRVGGIFVDGIESARTENLMGRGIGMGSNVAAQLLTGTPMFLLSEMEWGRVIQEFGPVFGLAFMVLRVVVGGYLTVRAFRSMMSGSALAWLLVPCAVPSLVITIMEQSTNLGFMVLSSGLCLAASRRVENSLPLPVMVHGVIGPRDRPGSIRALEH
jgi:hypothetical protein